MKRLTYLLTILCVIGAVVAIGYFLRYRAGESEVPILGQLPETQTQGSLPTPSVPATPETTPTTPSQPSLPQVSAGGNKFGVAAQDQIFDFFVTADNNILFVEPNGKIGRVVNGASSFLSASEIANLRRASFSYDGKKILAEFGNVSAPQYSVFDVESKSWQPLATNIRAATWSPNSYEIAYLTEKGGENMLAALDIINPKAKPREILSFNAEDVVLFWPETNRILVSEKSGAAFAASVFAVNVKNGSISLTVPPRIGLDVLWDRNATRGLIFVGGRLVRGGELGLIDGTGTLLNRLAFLTLPHKCTFYERAGERVGTSTPSAAEFLLCAVPRDSEKLGQSPLPDAYEQRSLFTSDDLYEIGLQDGAVREIYRNEASLFDAYDLKVFGKNLFFVNRIDQKLYAVSLE